MPSFEGKQGLITGIANDRSIAAAIAAELHAGGARAAFTHLPDADPERPKAYKRLMKVVGDWDPALVMPCDVSDDAQLDAVFGRYGEEVGRMDFLVHAIAFAPIEDLKCPTHESSRAGFLQAMEVSCYSLLALARRAKAHMTEGGSILALTYLGGESVIPGYNMMGVCKAALESAMTYTAAELGPMNIRVNAISAGPLRTLAASAVGDFAAMTKLYEHFSPLRRTVTHAEVGQAAAFLLSDAAAGITGENLHVDAGYHVMGAPPEDAQG